MAHLRKPPREVEELVGVPVVRDCQQGSQDLAKIRLGVSGRLQHLEQVRGSAAFELGIVGRVVPACAPDRRAIRGRLVRAQNEDGPAESEPEDALELGGLQLHRT